jgi:NTP pyrophosphatase (non-canonical NTP hydrolase)
MGYTIWPDGPTGDVLAEVNRERHRQEEPKREGRFTHTCADDMPLGEKYAVLGEEVGEVARCVLEMSGKANDKHNRDLRKELIQVAAVCVAWAESLAARNPGGG